MGITPLLKKAGSRRIPFGELPPVKLLPGEPPAPAPAPSPPLENSHQGPGISPFILIIRRYYKRLSHLTIRFVHK